LNCCCCCLLLAGEVPKFFDGVLSKRANEAVQLKGAWWAARQEVAAEGLKQKAFSPFSKLPLPQWQLGSAVDMGSLAAVTDKYFKAMEPRAKLRTPVLPAQVSEQLSALSQSMGGDGNDLKVRRRATQRRQAV
jgi:hypothetical protein